MTSHFAAAGGVRHSRRDVRVYLGASGLLAAAFAATSWLTLSATSGQLTYALDDAYIHMTIARNVVLHGVWGINAGDFAAASSSPLWTVMLASVFAMFGVRDAVPLALNLVFAVWIVVGTSRMLVRARCSHAETLAVVGALTFLTPIATMVWVGMEHTLQILLTLLLVASTTGLTENWSASQLARAGTIAAFATATRYESVFVIAGCALALVFARHIRAAATLLVAGLLPVAIVGAWNVSHGWFFLPASILMKQTVLQPSSDTSLAAALLGNLRTAHPPPVFLWLLAAALILLTRDALVSRNQGRAPLIVFVTASLLHLLLARFGWLYRYEAYLIALGTFSVGLRLVEVLRMSSGRPLGWRVLFAGAAVCVIAGGERSVLAIPRTAAAAGHVHEQHRQVAEFLARYYDGAPVALNDIGAVGYYTHVRVYDLMGLASVDAAMLRRSGHYDADHINRWLDAEGVALAVVYDAWFTGGAAFTREWERAGVWDTGDGGHDPETRVTFYAREAGQAQELRAQLQEWRRSADHGARLTNGSNAAPQGNRSP